MSEELKEKQKHKLYVANIPKVIEKEDLKDLFERCGTVLDINFVQESRGVSKGWAIVEMESESGAKRAITLLNMYAYRGRNLKVAAYKSKEGKSFW